MNLQCKLSKTTGRIVLEMAVPLLTLVANALLDGPCNIQHGDFRAFLR
jgi:hypothetical protein